MSRVTAALARAHRETASASDSVPLAPVPLDVGLEDVDIPAAVAFFPEEHPGHAIAHLSTHDSGSQQSGGPPQARDAADPTAPAASAGMVAWYSEGFSDAIGDRLRLFDNTGPGIELLRFHPAIAAFPGFESSVRAQLEHLRSFRHPAFARARAVTWLEEPAHQLALASDMVAGDRLSRVLRSARLAGLRPDPEAVVWLLRQVLTPLAALHAHAPGLAHGLLGADRIILTGDGRLAITEYVLAPALALQSLTALDACERLRMAVPHRPGGVAFDPPGDVEQVARLAVGMLVQRSSHDDATADVARELATAAETWGAALPEGLSPWLLRASSAGAGGLATATEALEALNRAVPHVDGRWSPSLLPVPVPALPAPAPPRGSHVVVSHDVRSEAPAVTTAADGSRRPTRAPARRVSRAVFPGWRVVTPALGVLALAQASWLGVLLPRGDGSRGAVSTTWQEAAASIRSEPAPGPTQSVSVAAPQGHRGAPGLVAAGAEPPGTPARASAMPPGASREPDVLRAAQRPARTSSVIGWIDVAARTELRVYANGRLLGRTQQGTFRLPAGRHDLLLVSEQAGVRVTRNVQVVAGRTVKIEVLGPGSSVLSF